MERRCRGFDDYNMLGENLCKSAQFAASVFHLPLVGELTESINVISKNNNTFVM